MQPCFPVIFVMRIFPVLHRMDIAIIGGGLSGTLLAHYLLKADVLSGTLYLFEKDEAQLSRGIAYRASAKTQLLNVAAGNMNIPGLPAGNFYQWLVENGYSYQSDDFVPRALFGTYLTGIFRKSIEKAKRTNVKILTDEVIDIVKDERGASVSTASGQRYHVDKIVIANGILAPADPFFVTEQIKSTGLYQSNPWHHEYLEQLKTNDHITLIGTGLTMLDHAVALLRDTRQLTVTVFSRHALLPLPHKAYHSYSFPDYNIFPAEDIGALLSSIRKYYSTHKNEDLDWRNLIDRIRLEAPQLWKALNPESKKRFIRHLKPYWEIHRHRAPQQVLEVIEQAQRDGRFIVLKGRINNVVPDQEQLRITVANARSATTLTTNYLLNSSGLQQNLSLTSDGLLKKLFDRGYMIADSNNLGVETDASGALECNYGEKNIFTLGALRRAAVFECTAAKEIGGHAFQLSQDLVKL